jgi:hypothetical protein
MKVVEHFSESGTVLLRAAKTRPKISANCQFRILVVSEKRDKIDMFVVKSLLVTTVACSNTLFQLAYLHTKFPGFSYSTPHISQAATLRTLAT